MTRYLNAAHLSATRAERRLASDKRRAARERRYTRQEGGVGAVILATISGALGAFLLASVAALLTVPGAMNADADPVTVFAGLGLLITAGASGLFVAGAVLWSIRP